MKRVVIICWITMTIIQLQISGTVEPESLGHVVLAIRTNRPCALLVFMRFEENPLSTRVLRLDGGGASVYGSSEVEGPDLAGTNTHQPSRDAMERGRLAAQSVDPETLARMTAPQIQRLFAEHGAAGLDEATAEHILQQARRRNLESEKMEDEISEGSKRSEGSSYTRRSRAGDDLERDPWSGEVQNKNPQELHVCDGGPGC
jgi:hypothetical protein